MTPRFVPALILAALASSALTFESRAYAADPEPAQPDSAAAKPEPEAAKPEAPAGEAGGPDDPAKNKDAALVADAEAGGSPVELPGKTYRAVGVRYRAIIVPKFMMNLFGDGGRTDRPLQQAHAQLAGGRIQFG